MKRNLILIACLLVLLYPLQPALLAQTADAKNPPAQGAGAQKIDLNAATVQELETLPGIGAKTAERIVKFRSENGPFQKIEDLMNVQGIGAKKFERLRDLITVGQSAKK